MRAKNNPTHIEENQYAAYLTSRLHVTDNTAVILGSRVTDCKRSNEMVTLHTFE